MRGRGLKQYTVTVYAHKFRSPLMRGRGLKLYSFREQNSNYKSPLMRGRGLKRYHKPVITTKFRVAPHAGAWIETSGSKLITYGNPGRPSCGGVD